MVIYNICFGIIYLLIAITSFFLWFKKDKVVSHVNISNVSFNRIYTIILPVAVIVLGFIIRLHMIGQLPAGLHQDEASIGYESYILANYGVDRDGNTFPVYPITYGSGGGSPLMIYLNVLTTYLFGSGILTLRMLPAILGALTLPVFFLTMKVLCKDEVISNSADLSLSQINGEYLWLPLVTLCIITFCPWHVMLSRWSLDCNTTPFFVCLSLLLFAMGAYRQKASSSFANIGTLFSSSDSKKRRSLHASDPGATLLFSLSAICYAICLYSYGATTIVIPIHLLVISIFCVKTGRMSELQITLGIILFLIVSIPLALFYAVNYFGLPEITTPYFTIGSFTAKRAVFVSGTGFAAAIINNLRIIILNLSTGNSSEQILSYIPGFAPLLSFTFPFTIVGIGVSACRLRKGEIIDVFMASIFVPSLLFGLFVEEDITRMVLIFMPVIYYLARGFIFTTSEFTEMEKRADKKSTQFAAVVLKSIAPAIFFVGATIFLNVYFTSYNSMSSDAFMPGYGDACAFAESVSKDDTHIYSTYEHVSAPFMVALYYTKTSPYDFVNTVHYKDPTAEFRIADSFGKWTFGLPEDFEQKITSYKEEGNIFVLHKSELDKYNISTENGYEIRYFADFVVVR